MKLSQEELVNGIKHFWDTVNVHKYCCRYINHLKKVLPKAIELNGEAAGY